MSRSLDIVGFVPPDDAWRKMKAVWDACKEADIDCPPEVYEFFAGSRPDSNGQEQPIPFSKWQNEDEMSYGYDVTVSDIPKHVTVIRFYRH